MKAGPCFFIAFRYLLGRDQEGGRYLRGAAAGIALSLIPIIITLIVADGMIRGITDRAVELGTGHLQIWPSSRAGGGSGLEGAADYLREDPRVRGLWRERHGLGVVIGPAGKTGATIRAVDPSFWEDTESGRYLTVLSGEARITGGREVLLGQALAQAVGAEAGGNVRVMTARLTEDGRTVPRTAVFTVRGVISSGYRELDALWCVTGYEAGDQALPPSAGAYLIAKITRPYEEADQIAAEWASQLGGGFHIYTWKDLQRSQYSSYESTRQILLFIMALVVLVAAVNVSSATSMLALERRRDIAILKTGGASPADAAGIFIWGAFLTGLTGACTGISAGLLIGAFINPLIHALEGVFAFFSGLFHGEAVKILDPGYYLERIPVIINWPDVLAIFLFTLICAVGASWIPARRAGALKILGILRNFS
ncbi:MAG: FtsX-like permease family protein [Spirochaetaceae bacterium]|jgi:lipoprotein-releasing system permease protein|nr:FtsX-like permease family protein [Spirochaetaceae bacterium]